MKPRRMVRMVAPAFASLGLLTAGFVGLAANGSGASTVTHFSMVRSTAAANAGCLPNRKGRCPHRPARGKRNDDRACLRTSTRRHGLRPVRHPDPDAPFGVSWYQSDLETTGGGSGSVVVQGRFNHETFSLSPGGPANGSDPLQGLTGPAVKDTNVKFRPTSQFHLGLWFNSPEDAANAGCPGNVTPFNGEQHAGITDPQHRATPPWTTVRSRTSAERRRTTSAAHGAVGRLPVIRPGAVRGTASVPGAGRGSRSCRPGTHRRPGSCGRCCCCRSTRPSRNRGAARRGRRSPPAGRR